MWIPKGLANVSGWGIDGSSSGSATNGLMAAEIKIRDYWDCASKFKTKGFSVTSNRICAAGLRDACRGDPGGPLTCLKSGTNGRKQRYLCGIVSWDVSCAHGANSNYPGIYTDVTKYTEWIDRSRCNLKNYVLNDNHKDKRGWKLLGKKQFCLIHIWFNFRYAIPHLLRHSRRRSDKKLFWINVGSPNTHTQLWRSGWLDSRLDQQ